MDERKREYEYIEFEGKQVKVETLASQSGAKRGSLKPRILKALQDHPDGLSKTQVYVHAGCAQTSGAIALGQLAAAGRVSVSAQGSFGKPIICRFVEDSNG